MSTVRVTPDSALRQRVTVRSPRLLMVDRRQAGRAIEPGNVRQLLDAGALCRPGVHSVVVYRVMAHDHTQTGVVVEASVADYRAGRIRRHEATDPERERRLTDYTETAGVEQVPVTLTHSPRPGLRELLSTVTETESDVDFETGDGQVHSVWVARDAEIVRAARDELDSVATLYIADGHHRMAAAARYASRRSELGAEHPAAFTLGALFPSDEMRILGYPRSAPRPEGWATADVLAALAAAHGSAGIEECEPCEAAQPVPGTAGVFLDGRWYRLRLRTTESGLRAGLDVVALDEGVIAPLFGDSANTPMRVPSEPGATGWGLDHTAIGFLPHPPSVAQVMAISEVGGVMPAKSTLFDPKVSAGLFVRELM